jgi:hypothetical protein
LLAGGPRADLREMAMDVLAVHKDGGDLHEWVEAQHMNDEEKMGLWSLLPANVRRAIKDSQRGSSNEKAA